MKKITTVFSILCMGLLTVVHAQNFKVKDATIIHKGKVRPSMQTMVEPAPKEVKKAWDDYLGDKYNVNLKGIGLFANKDILKAEAVRLGRIDQESVTLFTRVVREGDMSKIDVFARREKDKYLGPGDKGKEYKSMKKVFKDFLGDYLSTYYLEQFNALQDEINDMEKNRIDLEEENIKLTEDIQKNETSISEMTQENEEMARQIENNKLKVDESVSKINTKRTALKTIKDKMKSVNASYKGNFVLNR